MTDIDRQQGNAIDRAAAQWAGRGARGLNETEKVEFDAWRKADPRHSGSYLRAMAIERLALVTGQEILGEDASTAIAQGAAPAPKAPLLSHRGLWGTAVAASIAVMIGFGGWMHFATERIATGRGEIRNVAMQDGSTVVLDTGSAIAASMKGARRTIALEEGQAWFEVAHDSSRPFEVRYGNTLVRATGTAFQVTGLADGVDVVVTEGTVDVLRDGRARPLARLKAGERFHAVNGRFRQDRLDAATVERHLAWRQGLIVLNGEPLAKAIEEVNRYNVARIRIVSPSLESRRVYGTFRARDPQGFARALGIAFDAEVEIVGNEILLK